MEAGFPAPDRNVAATKDEPILLSPDTQSDVEMNELAPAANPTKSASSLSPDGPPSPRQSEPPKAVPSSASPTQSNGASAPSLGGAGSHISPVENQERTTQAPIPSTTTARAAHAMPHAAAAHYPQAAQGPQPPRMNAPTYGTPSQFQHPPSLSKQLSTYPVAYLPSMAAMQPHAPAARVAAPAPSPANQGPRVPSHISPPHQPAPMQGNGPHQSHIYPSRTTASPVSSQLPFQEPHPASALDPYTMENMFTNGGYHLPDAGDSQLSPQDYVDQCNRLYAVVRAMNPSVVRRVIRDTWQSSLAGSEAHISFVVSQARFLRCSSFPANESPR